MDMSNRTLVIYEMDEITGENKPIFRILSDKGYHKLYLIRYDNKRGLEELDNPDDTLGHLDVSSDEWDDESDRFYERSWSNYKFRSEDFKGVKYKRYFHIKVNGVRTTKDIESIYLPDSNKIFIDFKSTRSDGNITLIEISHKGERLYYCRELSLDNNHDIVLGPDEHGTVISKVFDIEYPEDKYSLFKIRKEILDDDELELLMMESNL